MTRQQQYDYYEKICNDINISEWYKDIEKFLKPFERRNAIKEKGAETLRVIVDILSNLFGYDRFHINLNFRIDIDEDDSVRINRAIIYLYYPQLVVTNDNGDKTTVHNHFQELKLSLYNCYPDEKIHGLTTSPTYNQFLSGYIQSHVQTTNYTDDNFMKYCTGSETEYHTLREELKNSAYGVVDHEIWTLFFMNMITIAETESTGTVPYYRLAWLNFGNQIDHEHNQNIGNLRIYDEEYDNHDHTPVNWTMRGGKPYVKDDEKLERHCIEFINQEFITAYSKYFVYKDDAGNYYNSTKKNKPESIEDIYWYFKFKNKDFEFKVLDIPEETNSKYYVHPKVKNHVKKRLEQTAASKLIIKAIGT